MDIKRTLSSRTAELEFIRKLDRSQQYVSKTSTQLKRNSPEDLNNKSSLKKSKHSNSSTTLGKNPKFSPSDCIAPTKEQYQPSYVSYNGYELLSESQKYVVRLVFEERLNLFLTGVPGSGKSFLLKFLVYVLRKTHDKEAIGVTAPTGLAAVNLNGDTIHSFTGIGINIDSTDQALISRITRNNLLRRWKKLKLLIIDEISMVDSKFFSTIDRLARKIRGNNKPFGGIQILVSGDFYQLPPISKDMDLPANYCFKSRSWREAIQKSVILEGNFRQGTNNEFIPFLLSLRLGLLDQGHFRLLKRLQREVEYNDSVSLTELLATRAGVACANSERLLKLPGKLYTFKALDKGHPKDLKKLDYLLVEEKLELKTGAQVMMLKNARYSNLSNGSMGVVKFFATENLWKSFKNTFTAEELLDERLHVLVDRILQSEGGRVLNIRDLQKTWCGFDSIFKKLRSCLKLRSTDEPTYPVVEFSVRGSKLLLVKPEKFELDSTTMTGPLIRIQIPLMLSWAISIHKSQGMTLDRLKVDLNGIFERGQFYVAVSRARSIERLQVINFNPRIIKNLDEVTNFYNSLIKQNDK